MAQWLDVRREYIFSIVAWGSIPASNTCFELRNFRSAALRNAANIPPIAVLPRCSVFELILNILFHQNSLSQALELVMQTLPYPSLSFLANLIRKLVLLLSIWIV